MYPLVRRARGLGAECLGAELAGPGRLVDVDQHVLHAVTEGAEPFATHLPNRDIRVMW